MKTNSRNENGSLKRLGTTANDVFARLMETLLSGEHPGNTPLREAQLARQWGVSRTPLREAVRRAAEAGLLVLRPNQAPIVRPLSLENVANLYDLRELLEMKAFELAWPRMGSAQLRALEKVAKTAKPNSSPNWQKNCLDLDRAMHAFWMKECGNSWLTADLARLTQFLRIFQSWIGRDQQWLIKSYSEHIAIIDAIRRRDKSLARNRLRSHIRNSAKLVRARATKV